MSEPLRINCQSFSEIPDIDEIKTLATDEYHLVLQFPRSVEPFNPDSIINRLSVQLPEYSVFYSGTTKETHNITVMKVIDEQVILENVDLFLNAIRNYLNLANNLITRLAKKLNYPAENISVDWIFELEKTNGKLEGDWGYMFHGQECRFRNLVTEQIVDARLRDYRNELAIPDPYFFAQYVRTTEAEAQVSDLVRHDFHDTRRALDVLAEKGYLNP